MSDQQTLLAAWVLPLSGDARTGVDARYDAGYELIRAELAKLDAVSAPPVDWDAVRKAADVLLRERSKDLFVAAALARALHVADGLPGLALGLALLARLSSEFGGGLFPVRARARVSALAWLAAQVARALADCPVVARDREAVAGLRQHFDGFLQHTRALLGDDAPSFSELRDALARMELSLPVESAPAPAPAPPAPSPSAPVAEPPPVLTSPAPAAMTPRPVSLTAAPAAPADAGEVTDYLSKAGASLAEAASVLWRAEPTAARPYRLLRIALWLHIEAPPQHDAAGVTAIPPPDERLAERLRTMLQHGAFAQLLETSEATLRSARFWLDLHFFCDRALEGLGPEHVAARAAARAGVGALLARMPGLPSLSFADGTPLARPETRAWLEPLTATGVRAGANPQTDAVRGLEDLRVALRGAAASQALREVDARRRSCGSARQRFVVDLEVAEALVAANLPLEAQALYAALAVEVERHALEAWEPDLSLALLTGYLRCLQRIEKAEPPMSELMRSLRMRVAKLSPAALVSLGD